MFTTQIALTASLLSIFAAAAHTQAFPSADMARAHSLIGDMQALSRRMAVIPTAQAPLPATAAPLDTPFQALGPTGKTGRIDGPFSKGNGRYRVELNSTYELRFIVQTGYMDGQLTLKRDPITGLDSMRLLGRMWDRKNRTWGPTEDNTKAIKIEYDSQADTGCIHWLAENNTKKTERFYNGRSGRRMTIEFEGWGHDFYQD
ncbi:MAG: hypothetical protein WC881_03370 [Elusimicrobiota bacterium]|jgi:hypothetical protein